VYFQNTYYVALGVGFKDYLLTILQDKLVKSLGCTAPFLPKKIRGDTTLCSEVKGQEARSIIQAKFISFKF
jgi:hypothetical protein